MSIEKILLVPKAFGGKVDVFLLIFRSKNNKKYLYITIISLYKRR